MAIQKITSGIIQDGAVAAADIVSVSNTAITGTITAAQIAAVNGAVITANTVANSALQTGSVENYLNAQGTSFGMRNRIINGAMTIDQRNNGSVITPGSTDYTVDRWHVAMSQSAKFSTQQDSSANTVAGFSSSLKVVSSSSYSVGSSDYFSVSQCVEGYNAADLAWGTASAKTITLSLYVLFKLRSFLY